MIDALALKGGETVLDFGCGTATLSIRIKERYPNVTVVGLDVDKDILRIAEKKIMQKGLAIALHHYDGAHLPFRGSPPFDRVISSLVFHHLTAQQKASILSQLSCNIKPGGKLLVADFGKPKTLYTELAFGVLRRFDGRENTQVNAEGCLLNGSEEVAFRRSELFLRITLFSALWI